MAILKILQYPDEKLHTVAAPVGQITDRIRTLINDMAETMYAAPGIGLAATQVDVHERVIVIDTSEERNNLLFLINPEITASNGISDYEEGCLSVPGIYGKVQRAESVSVRALNTQGESFVLDADGLLAVCIQHEMDHLEGKLFVDYLSSLKRQRIKKKLEKQHKLEANS